MTNEEFEGLLALGSDVGEQAVLKALKRKETDQYWFDDTSSLMLREQEEKWRTRKNYRVLHVGNAEKYPEYMGEGVDIIEAWTAADGKEHQYWHEVKTDCEILGYQYREPEDGKEDKRKTVAETLDKAGIAHEDKASQRKLGTGNLFIENVQSEGHQGWYDQIKKNKPEEMTEKHGVIVEGRDMWFYATGAWLSKVLELMQKIRDGKLSEDKKQAIKKNLEAAIWKWEYDETDDDGKPILDDDGKGIASTDTLGGKQIHIERTEAKYESFIFRIPDRKLIEIVDGANLKLKEMDNGKKYWLLPMEKVWNKERIEFDPITVTEVINLKDEETGCIRYRCGRREEIAFIQKLLAELST